MRTHSIHVCRECGATSPRWVGRCPGCAAWNSLDEERSSTHSPSAAVGTVALHTVGTDHDKRLSTGVGELDRVLGGGLLAGSTTLLFGEPGVGKSTLALMSLRALALRGASVVLIGAEESAGQVAQRARRLGPVPEGLEVATTTSVASVLALIEQRRPQVCVIDSISAMSDDGLGGVAGSVAQVRNAAERLCALAKATSTALVLVGHVTKDGELAGPRALEHLVDTVVRIEGDRYGTLRVVRAIKHRFGPTGEVGLLEMVNEGLRDLPETAMTLRQSGPEVPGVVFTVTNDGSRSFLVEVQALVASSSGSPRRVAHQVSSQRLSLMLAVLEARCDIDVSDLDVFSATAGGLAATEPSVDLALALAVASAAEGFALARTLVVMGEVGLAGELRAVSSVTRRVREAQRLGATRAIVPSSSDVEEVSGIVVVRCSSLSEAIAVSRGH
ncbi:MAG: DNA repair protein RadA [Acidobacteriota bacterium]|nr:DNA repair protein RadA [Acidobacteriota bacterium]MDE3092650.1 DNA repair protein RadA [Acidobacteriota bacterium]MDE3138648.1 DNA repair protein RadA [Acidobacteriota bacterium]MDE3147116.1 DNA repair protein RadA [Acidobacteriota bacterium]